MPTSPGHRTPRHAVVSTVGALLVAAGTATAQDALGAGNALDGNLNVQGRQNPTAPRIQDTINAANAIVTGNAARGAGFRGELDYTASGDFRADLGADALSSFRRDSFFSGLAGRGIRGTEAVQFQSALVTSATPSVGLLRNLVLDRPFSNTQADNLRVFPSSRADTSIALLDDGRGALPEFDPAASSDEMRMALDEQGAALWSLRSASAYNAMRPLNPALVATLGTSEGNSVGITASTIRGLRAEVLGQQRIQTSVDLRDRTESSTFQLPGRASEPGAQSPGQIPGLEPDPDADTDSDAEQTDTPRAYLELLERFEQAAQSAERSAEQPPEQATGRRSPPQTDPPADPGVRPTTPTPRTDPGDLSDATDTDDPGTPAWVRELVALRESFERAYTNRRTEADRLRTPEQRTSVDEAAVELLTRARGQTDSFRVPIDVDSLYAGHLAAAELLLSERRYFDAEHRFTRALALRPANAVAQIGRVHAQMGACMAWSASNNLRLILTRHPELVAERYGPALLPEPEHIDRLAEVLNTSLGGWLAEPDAAEPDAETEDGADAQAERPDAPNSPDQRARALLLAYAGYQSQRADLLDAGVGALERLARDAIDAGNPAAEGDLMLAKLVRTVWVIDGE